MTQSKVSCILRWALAFFFILAGIAHFLKSAYYLKIMPPWIPEPRTMVYVSGFFEGLLGALVLPVKTRRLAGWGLIALLLAVFPANLHMALHAKVFYSIPAWVLWARLPFQGVFIFWVLKATDLMPPSEDA